MKKISYTKLKTSPTIISEGETRYLYEKRKIDLFDESILELGDIGAKAKEVNSIVAIFDLEGFTNFCSQMDQHLQVPKFMSAFLKWIFRQLKISMINKEYEGGYDLFSEPPFFSKFLGDGMMFIWNTSKMGDTEISNVVVTAREICTTYEEEFLKTINKSIILPPTKLRCGVARGKVYSVGNGNDYVGSCINLASRLQKMSSLPFCFSIRGINIELNSELNKNAVIKTVKIRGIGDSEKVGVFVFDFDSLSPGDKAIFAPA